MTRVARPASHVARIPSPAPLRTHFARRTSHAALLSLCPICFDASGALTGGARAGALTLAIVTALVIAGFVRFAWRLR
jgi:hypothetical protein